MLRIFVTGDNHIGRRYSSHPRADLLVSERISAFQAMVDKANDEGCSLFIITGDMFDNTYSVAKKDVKALLDTLSRFNGDVAVLPGNHDFYDKETKLWQYFSDVMADMDNILLLSEYRPYRLSVGGGEVVLYPALCTSLHSERGENNLGWIKELDIPQDGAYHIGVAHGAVEGETIDSEARYFMMTRSELEAIPIDLWLIGHTHVPFPRNLTEEYAPSEKILNAGTHVQTDVSCNTEGMCFVVELSEEKKIRAKKFCPSTLRFVRRSIEVSDGRLSDILDRELRDIGDYSVVDIILSGAVSAEEYDSRAAVIETKLSRFIEGTYSDTAMTRRITSELIQKEFAETSLSARLLNALSDPKEIQLAYELLKSLQEVGR